MVAICRMASHQEYEKLLYQYEVLLARLSVREHFLKTVVREVYENIGQVLSLIRVQLSSLQPGFAAESREGISSSGELVGQTIRELRTMCRLFYPEENILGQQGFPNAVQTAILNQYPGAVISLPAEQNEFSGWQEDRLLLLYSIVLEVVEWLKRQQHNLLHTALVHCKGDKLFIELDYTGEVMRRPRRTRKNDRLHLSVFDRVEMLGGTMVIKKYGAVNRRIKLALPKQ